MEILTPITYAIPGMNRREIPILNLVCHAKPNNNNLLPGFRVVLGSFYNSLLSNRKGKQRKDRKGKIKRGSNLTYTDKGIP